jgi:hypothetical protein
MNVAAHIEVIETHCRFRPPDEVTIVEGVDLVARAIAYCRERKLPKLLVDASRLTHFATPTLVDRFLMAEDWAREAQGMVVVAMVVPERLIHPEKFGMKVAADSGLRANVFASEREAVEWLLAQSV